MLLFLPFLQMKSGHHQAAEALKATMKESYPNEEMDTIDILHETFPRLEKVVTQTYLKWITFAPSSYSKFFEKQFHQTSFHFKPFDLFEKKMIEQLYRIIQQKKPTAIICTHSYPSRLVGILKAQGKITQPLMNCLTDFFVDTVWEKQYVDGFLVPSEACREELERTYAVEAEKIHLYGIPVHPIIQKRAFHKQNHTPHILIAGGNLGLVEPHIVAQLQETKSRITVLCGDNVALFKALERLDLPNVTPLAYITSRYTMNALYDDVDALISKPGGVTVSEALRKHIPLFVNYVLPGQEQLNLAYLEKEGLAFSLQQVRILSEVERILANPFRMHAFDLAVDRYVENLEKPEVIAELLSGHDQSVVMPL